MWWSQTSVGIPSVFKGTRIYACINYWFSISLPKNPKKSGELAKAKDHVVLKKKIAVLSILNYIKFLLNVFNGLKKRKKAGPDMLRCFALI